MRISLISLLLLLPAAQSIAAPSHCSAGEKVVFSCAVGKGAKVVSLCASPNLTAKSGTLYYRFGAPSKIELEYPSKPHGAARKFRHAHYSRAEVDRFVVAFDIGNNTYSVFDFFDENENPKNSRGVAVTPAGAESPETNLYCKGAVTAELQQLEDKVPCDVESALARCK